MLVLIVSNACVQCNCQNPQRGFDIEQIFTFQTISVWNIAGMTQGDTNWCFVVNLMSRCLCNRCSYDQST